MDWTKSKSILIVALLITNIIIAGAYYISISENTAEQIAVAQNTQTYLLQKGIKLNIQIPTQSLRKSVLFVRFEAPEAGVKKEPVYYDEMLVETSIEIENQIIPLTYGDTKRDISSASYALLKFDSSLDAELNTDVIITNIELIYLVNTSEYDEKITEDTAVPTWKIETTNGKSYYVNAYGE